MANRNAQKVSAIRSIVVTTITLVAIQVLQLIPIFGLRTEAALANTAMNSRFSIAAVAVAVWTMSAILVQVAMLAMPASWNRHLGRDGLVNPFGWVVLGLTAVLAYSQATGIEVSLRSMALVADTQPGMMLVIASLYLGTAGVIMTAWIIDRFGMGHGFWIVLAASAVVDLTTGVMRTASLISTQGLLEALAPVLMAAAIIATSVFITRLVLQNGGRFEFVAWPLLVLTLVDMSNNNFELPDILEVYIPLTILVITLVPLMTFVFLRCAGLLGILLPVAGLLSVVAVLELWLIGSRTFWMLPPINVGLLVASTATLTALWHESRHRPAVMPVIKEQ